MDPFEIVRMGKKDLDKLHDITSLLVRNANQRARRLKVHKQAEHNALVKAYEKRGEALTTRGIKSLPMDEKLNTLKSVFFQARKSLLLETSTIKGFNKFIKDNEKRSGYKYNTEESKTFWNVYNRLMERNRGAIIAVEWSSSQLQKNLHNYMVKSKDHDIDTLYEEYEKQLDREYAKRMGFDEYMMDEY